MSSHGGTEYTSLKSEPSVMSEAAASCHVSHQEAFHLERGQDLQMPYTNFTYIRKPELCQGDFICRLKAS